MKRTLAIFALIAAQLALIASPTMPWLKNARGPSGAGGGGPTEVASDNFNSYSNGNNLTVGNWAAEQGAIVAFNGAAYVDYVSANAYYRNTSTFSANQYSTVTIANITGNEINGVTVRQQTGSVNCYYLFHYRADNETKLYRVNGGAATQINASSVTISSGYKLWLEVTGSGSSTRLTAKHDTGSGWVTIWSSVDPGGTYIDGGSAGIGGFGNGAGMMFEDWSGGNL